MILRISTDRIKGKRCWFLAAAVVVLITILLGGCKGSDPGGVEKDGFSYQLTHFEVTVLDSQYEDAWDHLGGQFDIDYESDLSMCTIVISSDSVKIHGPSLSSDRNTWETIADNKDEELDLPGYVELSDGMVKGRRVSASSDKVTMMWRDLDAQFDESKITGTFVGRERHYDGKGYVEIDMTSVSFEGMRID